MAEWLAPEGGSELLQIRFEVSEIHRDQTQSSPDSQWTARAQHTDSALPKRVGLDAFPLGLLAAIWPISL